jgi:hypothetical protein
MVLADHSMFTIIGRYHIYTIFLIAQVVLADRFIFTMVGRYHIYTVFLIVQVVPADSWPKSASKHVIISHDLSVTTGR